MPVVLGVWQQGRGRRRRALPKALDVRSGSQGGGHEDEEEEMDVGVGVFGLIGR